MSSSTPWAISTKNSVAGTGSDAIWAFAQRVNVDTTTNLNNLTPTTVPVNGVMTTNGTGWAINGNGIQLIGADSLVKCTFSLHITAASNRPNLTSRLSLNGVPFGPISASGYIRNNNGHNESSLTVTTWVQMSTNDIITIETLREAAAGTVTMDTAGTSQLLLERLVNV